ncbi:MAG: Oxidoreductase, partial [uncultured Solirubrobacteraceae bacterium]
DRRKPPHRRHRDLPHRPGRHADVRRGPAGRGPLRPDHPRRPRRGRQPHRHRRRLLPVRGGGRPQRAADRQGAGRRRVAARRRDRRHEGRPRPAGRRVGARRLAGSPARGLRGLAARAGHGPRRPLPAAPPRPARPVRRVGRRAARAAGRGQGPLDRPLQRDGRPARGGARDLRRRVGAEPALPRLPRPDRQGRGRRVRGRRDRLPGLVAPRGHRRGRGARGADRRRPGDRRAPRRLAAAGRPRVAALAQLDHGPHPRVEPARDDPGVGRRGRSRALRGGARRDRRSGV